MLILLNLYLAILNLAFAIHSGSALHYLIGTFCLTVALLGYGSI